jgi:hypothetical protein
LIHINVLQTSKNVFYGPPKCEYSSLVARLTFNVEKTWSEYSSKKTEISIFSHPYSKQELICVDSEKKFSIDHLNSKLMIIESLKKVRE